MASTYSDLKIELIGTGEQVGTWGSTTNTNLGTALEEAIVGSADVAFSSADVTLTLTNTNGTQSARHLRLNLTGTSGGARNLVLGSGCQIDKPYIINNGLADTVTVKNTTGTGVAVPAGKTMWVFNNGTNVVEVMNHADSLTLGTALPIASGGTGTTSTTFVNLATNVTGDLPFSNLAQGSALSVLGVTGNSTADVASIAAGTDHQVLRRSGTALGFGAVALNQSAAVTGTLPVGNGGTGASSLTANNVLLGNGTSAVQVVAPGSNGNVLTSNGTTWVSNAPAAPSSAAVGNAYASLSFDGVGTYALLISNSLSTTISRGSTYSGSSFSFFGMWAGGGLGGQALISGISGGTPSGTWRAMCELGNSTGAYYASGLFLRIS
jgi:hypothetical protein